jgi:hypothetical protein
MPAPASPTLAIANLVHQPTRRLASRIMADLAELACVAAKDNATDDAREALSAIRDEADALVDTVLPPMTAEEAAEMRAWWDSPEAFGDTEDNGRDASPASAATDLF